MQAGWIACLPSGTPDRVPIFILAPPLISDMTMSMRLMLVVLSMCKWFALRQSFTRSGLAPRLSAVASIAVVPCHMVSVETSVGGAASMPCAVPSVMVFMLMESVMA